eukprot:9186719-Pyramimonas_sp.AAC.1
MVTQTTDQSDAGRTRIVSRRTNQTQDAREYSNIFRAGAGVAHPLMRASPVLRSMVTLSCTVLSSPAAPLGSAKGS